MASDKYNTELSEKDEKAFAEWLAFSGRADDLQDYDMRGWWKKNGKQDERGHFSDEFKKPNHPTFSKESVYHGVDGHEGGEWIGDEKNGWEFKASKSNIKNMTPEQMQEYFTRVEPNAKLTLPEPEPEPKKPSRRELLYGYGAEDAVTE